ncbi:MAG: DUF1214 domain-containing protein [Alphaproteobacteria bacterium]|nr:DUF1214 domain-containing protein [Alphaproteobacteria bacterium]
MTWPRLSRILIYAGALVLGVILGLGSLYAGISSSARGVVQNGVWLTDLNTGSTAAGPYTRANVAMYGLLALNRSEAIYYFADRDASGDALSGRCSYVIEGRDPDARWWSITVYGTDGFLMAASKGRFSASSALIARRNDGSFSIALNAQGTGENGLPTGGGEFTMVLRLYNPGPDIQKRPGETVLPQLRRVSCNG